MDGFEVNLKIFKNALDFPFYMSWRMGWNVWPSFIVLHCSHPYRIRLYLKCKSSPSKRK